MAEAAKSKQTKTRTRRAASEVEVRPTPRRRRGRPFQSYEQAIRFLDDRVNVERLRAMRVDRGVFKLDRMRAMLAELGDPHLTFPSVHVAGSKGKGSVCEMVASCLKACGYTVGLYTSPHLVDVRERIRIGGEMIEEDQLAAVLGRCRDAARAVEADHGQATYFEVITLAGFIHFAEQAVDLAVVEVGLGGRLDSTNVINPLVCGLTSIQLEHTDILGTDLPTIAAEKAGIMKPGVPTITVPQTPEVIDVFRHQAETAGAELAVLGEDVGFSVRFEAAHAMGPHARVCVSTPRSAYEHLPAPLPGDHQAVNCGLALAMVDRLREHGFDCGEVPVAEGLAATPRRGRMETVWREPRVMIDGAHTKESVAELIRALGATQRFDSMVVIFGAAADKDVDAMLDEVGRGADKIIFTKARGNPRALDPHELSSRFQSRSEKMFQVEPDVKAAINAAAKSVGRDDLIVITGSFYLAGEAKALFDAKKQAAR